MGDYRKLWQELGMELEKHDMLCEALPPLYEKVYLTQQNRPEAMGYFDFVISEIHGARVEELAVHNRAGGKKRLSQPVTADTLHETTSPVRLSPRSKRTPPAHAISSPDAARCWISVGRIARLLS